MVDRPYRVLVAKPGLDGHDRGAKIVAKALRDDGFEVIYTGLRAQPEHIVSTAVDEDVDVIGISLLSGAHNRLCARIMEQLKAEGMGHVPVFLGGIIPDDDIPSLKAIGIKEVFGPGVSTVDICRKIRSMLSNSDVVN